MTSLDKIGGLTGFVMSTIALQAAELKKNPKLDAGMVKKFITDAVILERPK